MSKFPTTAQLITSITQRANLKRDGLISDCILPRVRVNSCEFSWRDWEQGLAKALKDSDSQVTCHSDVKSVGLQAYELKQSKLQDWALQQPMTECCTNLCGEDVSITNSLIAANKTISLQDRLLIGRELRTVTAVTDESQYTDQTGNDPEDTTAEGSMFVLTETQINDPNFGLLKFFQDIQANNYLTGKRTTLTLSQNMYNALLRHPDFKDYGCLQPPLATPDNIASLIGVRRICIADAGYNNGVSDVAMENIWPNEYISLTVSQDLLTTQDQKIFFGFTAWMNGFYQNIYLDKSKGPRDGVEMQKQSHDLTGVIASYKASTLIKVTAA